MTPERVEIFPAGDIGVVWSDGREDYLAPRMVRAACPCAQCVDELTGRRRLDPRLIPDSVRALEWTPVGHYAVHFRWSDGHATGIYPFDLLRRLGDRA